VQAFAAANVVALQGSPPAVAAVRPMPRPRTIPAAKAAAVDEVLTLVLSSAISDDVFPSFVYCFMDSSLKSKRPVSITGILPEATLPEDDNRVDFSS